MEGPWRWRARPRDPLLPPWTSTTRTGGRTDGRARLPTACGLLSVTQTLPTDGWRPQRSQIIPTRWITSTDQARSSSTNPPIPWKRSSNPPGSPTASRPARPTTSACSRRVRGRGALGRGSMSSPKGGRCNLDEMSPRGPSLPLSLCACSRPWWEDVSERVQEGERRAGGLLHKRIR